MLGCQKADHRNVTARSGVANTQQSFDILCEGRRVSRRPITFTLVYDGDGASRDAAKNSCRFSRRDRQRTGPYHLQP